MPNFYQQICFFFPKVNLFLFGGFGKVIGASGGALA